MQCFSCSFSTVYPYLIDLIDEVKERRLGFQHRIPSPVHVPNYSTMTDKNWWFQV